MGPVGRRPCPCRVRPSQRNRIAPASAQERAPWLRSLRLPSWTMSTRPNPGPADYCFAVAKEPRRSRIVKGRSVRGQFAVEVGGGDTAVHEEVAAGDESAVGAHEERADGPDLVWSAGAPGRRQLDHAPVSLAAGTGQLVLREWGDDDAGADRVDPRAALAPPDGLGHHAQRVRTLGQLVRVQGVCHLVGLKHRQRQQLVGWCRRESGVLLGGQGPQAVPGLRRDDHPGAAACDDVPELLEQHCGSVEVHVEDRLRRRLAGRDPRGVDDTGDVAERRGGLDERVDRLARGHVDGRCAHLEAGVAHHLGRRVGVALPQVRQHDVLTGADPPGDRLADRAGSDDDNDFVHDQFSFSYAVG